MNVGRQHTSPPRTAAYLPGHTESALLSSRQAGKLACILLLLPPPSSPGWCEFMTKRYRNDFFPSFQRVTRKRKTGSPGRSGTGGGKLTKPQRCATVFCLFGALSAGTSLAAADSIWQSHRQILDTAKQHVLNSPVAMELKNVSVKAGPLDKRLRLRKCREPLEAFSPASTRTTGRISVEITCPDDKPWSLYVPVALTAEYPVVTLVQSLPRGTLLGPGDLRLTSIRSHPVATPYIGSVDQATGKELSRSLSAGTRLTQAMLRNPRVINRGDTITMIVASGPLVVRSSGTALQDGTVGQKISLRNTRSRRTVEGWVQTDGSVRVLR